MDKRLRCLTLAVAAAIVLSTGISPESAGARAQKAIWGPALRDGRSLFPTYRDLGVSVYQDTLPWEAIATHRPSSPRDPSDRAYVWPAEVTWAVAEARRYHMSVALQLIGTPRWANGGRPWRWVPRRARDFAEFARAAARRYPSVHLWMIWGEPSRARNFAPLTPARPFARLDAAQRLAPHLYARLLDAAYGELKRESRANLVVGGMTDAAASISTPQWIENMRLPDGRPPRLDLYGHNPFTSRAPNLANPPSPAQQIDFSDIERLQELVDRNLTRTGKPALFLSEWTIPTAIDREFDYYVDPRLQATWITDGLGIARRLTDVYAVGWIHLYDNLPASAGGLLTEGGRKKPGYFAWQRG